MGFPLPPTPCRNVLLRHLCLAIGDPTVGEPPPNGLIEIAALRGRAQQRFMDCRWHAEVLIKCAAVKFQLQQLASSVDRKSTRLNSSHSQISYAVFCLKKKKK